MMSGIVKRSVMVSGHKTSISLEDEFWDRLKVIAAEQKRTLGDIVTGIDQDRTGTNLSSAIRLFILRDALARAEGGAA